MMMQLDDFFQSTSPFFHSGRRNVTRRSPSDRFFADFFDDERFLRRSPFFRQFSSNYSNEDQQDTEIRNSQGKRLPIHGPQKKSSSHQQIGRYHAPSNVESESSEEEMDLSDENMSEGDDTDMEEAVKASLRQFHEEEAKRKENERKIVEELGQCIHITDYESLNGDQYIGSDVINAYLKKLSLSRKNVQVLNTWFSSYLRRYLHPAHDSSDYEDETLEKKQSYFKEQVAKYTERINWNQGGLVLIPIHETNPAHWMLVIINLDKLVVEFWDSYSCINRGAYFPRWKQMMREWLLEFTPRSFRLSLGTSGNYLKFVFATEDVRHQTSGNDCGAFVCYYAQERADGKSLESLRSDPNCNPTFMNTTFRNYLKNTLAPFCQDNRPCTVVL